MQGEVTYGTKIVRSKSFSVKINYLINVISPFLIKTSLLGHTTSR